MEKKNEEIFYKLEAFSCDENCLQDRRAGINKVSGRIIDKFQNYSFGNFHCVISWKPALREDQLSSTITSAEKIINGFGDWEDSIPYPAIPYPKNIEERYSTDYSKEDKSKGRAIIEDRLNLIYRWWCFSFRPK